LWQDDAAQCGSAEKRHLEEAIVRNPVRKIMGVAVLGVLAALFAVPMSAGAQEGEGPAPTPPSCVILSVTPNPVTAFPSEVTVTGTVGADVHLTLFAQTPPLTGPLNVIGEKDVTAGAFSISGTVTAESDISVGSTFGKEGAYTGGCATPGGETVVRVKTAEATKPGTVTPAAAQLAFTGSSDTPSYVLIGIAAIVVGAVLVVAARRRSHLS
jgi:LPXTG-motif cell wall-anchored protein